MNHKHMLYCAAFAGIAIVLIGVGAGSFAFIPALGCALMMGMMVWMMVRPGGHRGS